MTTLREREAAAARERLDTAAVMLAGVRRVLALWSDSVRADAEQRHGADAPDEVMWADPAYSAALDAIGEAAKAAERLAAAAEAFRKAEQNA